MRHLAIVGVVLMGSSVGWGQLVIVQDEIVVDANALQIDPNQMKRLIEQAEEILVDANALEVDPNQMNRHVKRLFEALEAEGLKGGNGQIRRKVDGEWRVFERGVDFIELASQPKPSGATNPTGELADMVPAVLQGCPTKPGKLDANATGQQRLEWVAAMQKWKGDRAAWTKQIAKKWVGKKVHWITDGAFTRMGKSADANSVSVRATFPAVYRGKGNLSARTGLAEVVLGGCEGPAASLASKAADPNKHVNALDVRAVIDRIEVVSGNRTDANTPTHRVRITLKQCDLRIPPPDWNLRPRTPVKVGKGLTVGRHGKGVAVYGIKTKATHVVYILDGSGSLAMGGLFGCNLRETFMSISELGPSQRLSLLVSIDKKNHVFPHTGFAAATDEGKLNVGKFLEQLRPQGQADMPAALKEGLDRSLKVAKSAKTSVALYLVTDGVFSDKKAAAKAVKLIKTARKNNNSIEVHAILVGGTPKKESLRYKQVKAIAEAGGGKLKSIAGLD